MSGSPTYVEAYQCQGVMPYSRVLLGQEACISPGRAIQGGTCGCWQPTQKLWFPALLGASPALLHPSPVRILPVSTRFDRFPAGPHFAPVSRRAARLACRHYAPHLVRGAVGT